MAGGAQFRVLQRRRARTNGEKVARWLAGLGTATRCGTGVLSLTAQGELYEGFRLARAFVWMRASASGSRAFERAYAALRRSTD